MSLKKPVELVNEIDKILPQTQCGQCGYEGCMPYAIALVYNSEAINRCPPGGAQGIQQLAQLLHKNYLPLNSECGIEKKPQAATIQEELCIGCTKCITACPVDAILGAHKKMHTVITSDCTGCELCLPACPMECIAIIPQSNNKNTTLSDRSYLKENYLVKKEREHKRKQAKIKTTSVKQTSVNLKANILAAIKRRKKRSRNASS